MSRRLSTAQSLASSSAPRDQAYEIECGCGEVVGGLREPHAQTVSCPHCEAPLFVLPADCYAEAPRGRVSAAEPAGTAPSGLIDKLNRLAFWSKLRNGRQSLSRMVRQMGQWVKKRLGSKN